MPVAAGSAGFPNVAPAALALVVALDVERKSIARFHERLEFAGQLHVVQCGQGAARARRGAQAAIDSGATALMCLGLGGGVGANVAPGDIVIARTVVDESREAWTSDADWLDAVVRRLTRTVHVGTLVSVGVVLASPAAKADAARRFQALACDMESAAVAQVAAAASVPFLAIRVIADGPEDVLPAHVDRWVDDAGDSRIAPVLGALLRPQQWPPLFTLIRSYRAARATLEFVAAQLAPALYCCPGSR